MADTSVAITPGSGTNIDTRTESTNGNHRQVVVLGDPATNAGVAPVDATSGLKVDLGSDNDVTVTGTVDLGATDNAVLDTIAAKDFATQTTLALVKAKTDNIPVLGQALAAASVPVVLTAAQISTLTPPTPQTDALTDAQLRATAVPVSGTVTANLSATDNAVLDDIASDTEAIKTSLAGTLTVTGGGGGTEYTEDAAAAANPVGNAMILVRDDAISGSITTTNGDNIAARGNNKGEQYVKDTDAGALLTTIDADTSNISTKINTIAGAIAGTEMQVDVVAMPSVAVTNAGTFLVQNNAATPAGTNNIGDVDVLTVNGVAPAFGTGVRGANVQRVTIATDDSVPVTGTFYQATQPVSLASVPSHAVTNSGTFATQVDGAALTALQLIDDTVFADDAAVTLGSSKGNVAAGVAVATDGTDPTAVSAEGDAAALRTDMNRLLIVNQTHPRFWHVSADYASAQTNTSVKASPGASLSLYITDIVISNGATAGNITLLDGSGGTVLLEIYPAINGGATLSLRSPIKLTANTALCVTSSTVTTHSIFVSGYIAA